MCLFLVHWRRSAGFSRGQGQVRCVCPGSLEEVNWVQYRGQGQVRCVCPWFTGGDQLGSVGVRVRLGVFAPGSLAEVNWVQ